MYETLQSKKHMFGLLVVTRHHELGFRQNIPGIVATHLTELPTQLRDQRNSQKALTTLKHNLNQGSKQRQFVREGFLEVFRAIWRVFLEILPLQKTNEKRRKT